MDWDTLSGFSRVHYVHGKLALKLEMKHIRQSLKQPLSLLWGSHPAWSAKFRFRPNAEDSGSHSGVAKLTVVESGSSKLGLVTLLSGQSLTPQNRSASSDTVSFSPSTTVGRSTVEVIMDPVMLAAIRTEKFL